MLGGLRKLLTVHENKGCRCRMLWRWVVANVWRRVSRKPRILMFSGYEFLAYPDCSVGYRISWHKDGLFEYDYMKLFLRFVQSEDVFLDIGANVGAYTLLAASLATNGRVIGVEPMPETFARLEENIMRNGLIDRVDLVNKALGKESGFVMFQAQVPSTHSHVVVDAGARDNEVRIPCTTLDELAEELRITRCDFVKIDVEGYEEHVILGGRNFFKALAPKIVLFEASGACLAYGSDLTEAFEMFAELGYRIGFYRHEKNRISLVRGKPQTISPENNYLAMKSSFLEEAKNSCTVSEDG